MVRFMGFEDYTLAGVRLYCPNADEIFVNSATFPPDPDIMGLQSPKAALERIGVISLLELGRTVSDLAVQSSKRRRLETQSFIQSATFTSPSPTEST